jgi:hypothetical protein
MFREGCLGRSSSEQREHFVAERRALIGIKRLTRPGKQLVGQLGERGTQVAFALLELLDARVDLAVLGFQELGDVEPIVSCGACSAMHGPAANPGPDNTSRLAFRLLDVARSRTRAVSRSKTSHRRIP